jgi:hypothetical protein
MSALLKARQSSYSSQVNSLKGSPWHFNKGRSTIPPNRGTVLFNNPSPLVSSCLLFFPCVIRSPHLSTTVTRKPTSDTGKPMMVGKSKAASCTGRPAAANTTGTYHQHVRDSVSSRRCGTTAKEQTGPHGLPFGYQGQLCLRSHPCTSRSTTRTCLRRGRNPRWLVPRR